MQDLLVEFQAPKWLSSPHFQTIFTNRFRQVSKPAYEHERVELPDGDFVDTYWTERTGGPCVLCLPGIFGHRYVPYMRGIVNALVDKGISVVVLHYRGSLGVLNRLPQSYHSGATSDPFHVLSLIKNRNPQSPIGVIGFSLGGNLALKMLTEDSSLIEAAAVVSPPIDLYSCVREIQKPNAWLYQKNFMRKMRELLTIKEGQFRPLALDVEAAFKATNLFDFDDVITAPLHGFEGAKEYYTRCSTKNKLNEIDRPTCFISSYDDPVLGDGCYPSPEECSEQISLHLTQTGGHVGFLQGSFFKQEYWAEKTVSDFISTHLFSLL